MNRPSSLVLPVFLSACALFVVGPAIGAIMHESDQASLLRGAYLLSNGANPFAADYYNYDKQFLTYWLLAGLFALSRLFAPNPDYVLIGNIASALVFWTSIVALSTRTPRRLKTSAMVAVAALAPTFLVHSPFLATNYFSAAFLIAGYMTLSRPRRGALNALVGVALLSAAVGCRADAVLILPWILWITARPASMRSLFLKPLPWLVVLAGLSAVIIGKFICTTPGADTYSPWVTPKVFVVYAVAGLGACGLLFAIIAFCLLTSAIRTRRNWDYRVFALSGLFALGFPFVFYTVQLFSTRHWTLTVVACLLFASSRRGAAMLPRILDRRFAAASLLALALLPVFIGLSLPVLSRPALTINRPVLFPSADGLVPFGAIWAVNLGYMDRCPGVRDHNQSTWLAAKQTDFAAGPAGKIQIMLDTPLATILEFAAALQSKPSRLVPTNKVDFSLPAYTDLRHILRIVPDWSTGQSQERPDFLSDFFVEPASPKICGSQIVAIQALPDRADDQALLADLAQAFAYNEFSLPIPLPVNDAIEKLRSAAELGRVAVLASPHAFQLRRSPGSPQKSESARNGTHFLRIDPTESVAVDARLTPGDATFWFSASVLPAYMSIQAYQDASRLSGNASGKGEPTSSP